MDDASAQLVRVLVVDDHPLIREALRRAIVASDVELVGEARNGAEAIAFVERLRGSVDVVVMDAAMPVMGGLEAAEHLIRDFPDVRILIVSGFAETETVRRAFEIGVRGYLLKSLSGEQLVNGIRVVAGGGSIIDPTLRIDAHEIAASAEDPDEPTLSMRQREVLWMMAEGYTNKRIAKDLHLSPSTVKRHVTDILSRLGAHDRASAVAAGLRLGLIK